MPNSTIVLLSSMTALEQVPVRDLGTPLSRLRVAYISTAANGEEDRSYLNVTRNYLGVHCSEFREFDLDHLTQDELRRELPSLDAILVEGGNTFYLLNAIRKSGFAQVVHEALEQGRIYIGISAGAYVACPTVEMATWKKSLSPSRFGVTDFTAMSLVPFLVVAHYHPQFAEDIAEGAARSQWPVRILTDEQALVVKEGKAVFVGEGREHGF